MILLYNFDVWELIYRRSSETYACNVGRVLPSENNGHMAVALRQQAGCASGAVPWASNSTSGSRNDDDLRVKLRPTLTSTLLTPASLNIRYLTIPLNSPKSLWPSVGNHPSGASSAREA